MFRITRFFLLLIFLTGCAERQTQFEKEKESVADSLEIEIPDTLVGMGSAHDSLKDVFPKFQMGNIVFNTPDTMQFGETRGIQLLLSPKLTIQELEKQLEESGGVRQRRIRISRVMEANLTGRDFKIDPITVALQLVNPDGVTEWRWEVTALDAGRHNLYLSMNAILEIDGKELPHTIQTLYEVIEVQITWQQRISGFVAEHWKWLWTAIVEPLIGWLWERRKQRAKEKK